MKTSKIPATANSRGRGPYNAACDACAKKKTKCDGNKPICQPCQSQGRQKECTWVKNTIRKPRTEKYIDSMHKRYSDLWRYTNSLELRLDECSQYHHPNVDFRANRPPDPDALLGQEDDSDVMMGGDDNDHDSDDGNDHTVMAICNIPPQSLQVEPFTQPSRFPAVAENPNLTYVLVVDGIEPSLHNPTLDWSRHLPRDFPLDRPTHDRALDLLFKFHTSWCLRIIPALFLRDMYRALSIPPSQTPPKTPHYSPMLHNALVALALAFLDEPFNDFKRRQTYATTSKSFIESECRKPNLSVVHALSVLASYHSSHGDQTLGYMYFGMSARMSQALGLNNDFSEWVKIGIMDEADRLDRHWTSWTSFTQDVCWSLYVGRDFCVAEPIGAKATPMPHIDPKYDEMEWFYSPSQVPPQPNNLTKTFEASCRLLMIARRIMDIINGLNKARSRPLDDSIDDIDARLKMWKDSLSEELEITSRSRLTATPHKLMLHLAYWWLVILLHRPFFHRKSRPINNTDSEIDHVKICRQAAEQIMELLSTWRTLYKLRYCPVTLIQTVFSAGTVYLLIAMQASSGTRIAQKGLRHSLDQATLVQQYLQEIGLSWNCAKHISATLRRLMDEQVRPRLDLMDRKSVPITPGLHISPDIGEEEENNSSRSRSTSRIRPSITKLAPPISHPHTMSTGSGQSSLPTSPNHILTSTFPTQVPPPANSSISSNLTVSSACDTPSTHAARSVPIAIRPRRSPSSSNPSSFTDSRAFQPSPGSSPNVNYLSPSSARPDFRKYDQPLSNFMDDPFFNSGNRSSDDVEHGFGGLVSFLAHNFQPSPSTEYLGMLDGQTLSEVPFVVVEDTQSPSSSNSDQSPFGIGFPNHESSSTSLGEHAPTSSHGGNDSMDLDNVPWTHSFSS